MPSQANVEKVETLKENLSTKGNFIISAYFGISVNDINAMRKEMRGIGADLKVVKNNLFSIALKEKGYDEALVDLLKGPNVVAFTDQDLSGPAKILKKAGKSKDTPPITIKVGVADGTTYSKEDVEAIANLPSKDVLLAKIAASLNSPASGIVQTVNAVMSTLARAIEAVAKKNEES